MKLFTLLLLCFSLHAEPIEFVVYGGTGGPTDLATRKVQAIIEANSDLKMYVVPKPGAGHIIAYQYIHQTKKPTIFLSDITLIRDREYEGYPDGITDMVQPIYYLGEFNSILFANTSIKNYDELMNMKEVRIGYGGKGTFSEEATNEFCKEMNCLKVPYKTGAVGIVEVMSGVIDVYPLISFGADSFVNNPRLKVIGQTKKRNWQILFSKNLSKEDENTIVNVLSKQSPQFYKDLGLHYAVKNPVEVWNKVNKN